MFFLMTKKTEKKNHFHLKTKYEFDLVEFQKLNKKDYGVYCSANSFDLTKELVGLEKLTGITDAFQILITLTLI